jgi:hypothetical protein
MSDANHPDRDHPAVAVFLAGLAVHMGSDSIVDDPGLEILGDVDRGMHARLDGSDYFVADDQVVRHGKTDSTTWRFGKRARTFRGSVGAPR